MIDYNERMYLLELAQKLRDAIGKSTGKRERKIVKVADELEKMAG